MTVVNLSTVGPALGHPENVPIDGAATAVAWVGDAPYSYLDGAEVVMPAPLVVRIDDGVPDQPFDIPPDGGQYCWRIEVETWNPGHSIVRYVTVPASGPVDFEDLADVNRYSFDPEAEPEAAWWTAVNPFITAYNAGELAGDTGPEGPSAYDVAVANGFVGTEAAWLASLEGTDGEDGADGADGAVLVSETRAQLGMENDRERTLRRLDAAGSITNASGRFIFATFEASRDRTVQTVRNATNITGAAGVTLARVGLYRVEANGDLTLLSASVNDTTLWTVAGVGYTKNLAAPVALTKGQRYAVGVIVVATTVPQFIGIALSTTVVNLSPTLAGIWSGQTDLPASVTAATYAGSTSAVMFAEIY